MNFNNMRTNFGAMVRLRPCDLVTWRSWVEILKSVSRVKAAYIYPPQTPPGVSLVHQAVLFSCFLKYLYGVTWKLHYAKILMHDSVLFDMIFPWIPFVLPVFQCVDVLNWFVQLYPIIGDRYKCVDCEESIGFDLCGDCYNKRSKRPGRFNQKHTLDHTLMLVQYRRMLISRGQDSSDLIVIPDDPDSSSDEE